MPTSEVSPAGGGETSPAKKKKKPKKKKPEGAEGQQPQADPNAQGKQFAYYRTPRMRVGHDAGKSEVSVYIFQTWEMF